jgi:hypothetical protein
MSVLNDTKVLPPTALEELYPPDSTRGYGATETMIKITTKITIMIYIDVIELYFKTVFSRTD